MENFIVKAPVVDFWEEEVTLTKGFEKSETSNQRFVKVIVSGLKEDRQNERMSQTAINDMISQFKSGKVPFFGDHGRDPVTGQPNVYSWKSIMGTWVDANQEGDSLFAVVRLNKSHQDAETLWKFVNEGVPISFSIGGRPTGPAKEVEIEEDAV